MQVPRVMQVWLLCAQRAGSKFTTSCVRELLAALAVCLLDSPTFCPTIHVFGRSLECLAKIQAYVAGIHTCGGFTTLAPVYTYAVLGARHFSRTLGFRIRLSVTSDLT